MNERAYEEPTAGPSMHVVESLIAVPWSKEEGNDRVLGCKEEDDGELGQGEETCRTGVSVSRCSM